MYCQRCGKQIDEGARFCPGCGAQIGVSNQPAQAGAISSAASAPGKTKKSFSLPRMILILIVVGILVAGLGGLGGLSYILMHKNI